MSVSLLVAIWSFPRGNFLVYSCAYCGCEHELFIFSSISQIFFSFKNLCSAVLWWWRWSCCYVVVVISPIFSRSTSSYSDNSPAYAGNLLTLAVVNSSVSGAVKTSSCSHSSSTSPRLTAVVALVSNPRRAYDSCAIAPPQLPLVTSSSCCCSLSDCVCTPSTSPQQSVLWCVLSCIEGVFRFRIPVELTFQCSEKFEH